jgi:hypothetical protein
LLAKRFQSRFLASKPLTAHPRQVLTLVHPGCTGLDVPRQAFQIPRVSRPGGRSRLWPGEESPGSMEARCRITSGGGNPRDSATESKPPRLYFGFYAELLDSWAEVLAG